MKILHVIFSCNRLQYLTKTLESLHLLDYCGHQVDRLIIDDYPRTRNDYIFDLLGKTHQFNTFLHKENMGLSVTWSEFFDYLKTVDYDYIIHQEDDVLQRQEWYFHEHPPKIEESDTPIKQYYYAKNTKQFPIIFSFYRRSIINYPFREYWGFTINEGMIMVYLAHFEQMYSAILKNSEGKNIIEHIGEESTGRRILPGEPNWEQFAHMHPDKVYSSRDGRLIA